MDLSIIVLAAGQGTRMKSPLPKVLHPIGGKPMLAHVLDTAKALLPAQIILVHGQNGQEIKSYFAGDGLTWVEQAHQQGTGDAVAKALPYIPAHHRVLILYGDVPLISEQTLQRLLLSTPLNALGLLTQISIDPFGLGRIVRDEAGAINSIVEEQDANEAEREIREINTGILVAMRAHLAKWLPLLTNNNKQEEYYLTDIVQFAAKDHTAIHSVFPYIAQEVLGVNDRVQQAIVERCYQRQVAQQWMRKGVWICDPERFDLRGTLQAENDVKIDVNVILQGDNILKQGSHIGANSILINCDIGENVKVLANCYLENVIIKSGVVVGPFARLRPGTILAENAHIGNFVEIKNSYIGSGSKISHLSYIGDTEMGSDVNVGAGTITCNYDGVNKHKTIIENNVQIGSDCQLIAPICLKEGATIGAGSTLKNDAPAHQLTVSHQLKQRSVVWTRPTKDKPHKD